MLLKRTALFLFLTSLGVLAQVDRPRRDWSRVLAEPAPAETQLAARDAWAKRRARAAIELLRSEQRTLPWQILEHTPDPAARSYFIRDVGVSGIPSHVIARELAAESRIAARRALILALGAFDADQIPASLRSNLVEQLLRWYRDDGDAGVHSAIDWLLRNGHIGLIARPLDWGQQAALSAADRELSGKARADRNWFITREGQTMATLRGPMEFVMGAPSYEPGRDKGPDENLHRVRIPRSFAIATKEVTVGQFQRFLDANPAIKKRAQALAERDPSRGSVMLSKCPEDDCPQISMTWFEAAQYCNWLSVQEGIPEAEWVYPSLNDIAEGMTIRPGALQRTGYRLPTEAEWEFAARAGASTSRFFGNSEELLRDYAWYTGNSFNERSWPVGQLKPNDFGLFDVYGSVWEWAHDRWKPYPATAGAVREDTDDVPSIVSKEYPRPRRGGSFTYEAPFLRSAHRGGYIPDERRDSVGFRIARTIREPARRATRVDLLVALRYE